jgi:A/G-specific adenine glycosylase
MREVGVSETLDWVQSLVGWYAQHQRKLPWRRQPRPYPVWVSEIMLQQTQVDTMLPYYRRFMKRFPSVRALAAADIHDVLTLWQGLGYYARARNLHRAAGRVVEQHGGVLPRDPALLRALPGIGEYTVAAILSICFDDPLPVVDGNVARVTARFWAIDDDVGRGVTRRAIAERLEAAIRRVSPGAFNQAMMELGALVCRPRDPSCGVCPLAPECAARLQARVRDYPVPRARKAVPGREVVVGVIQRRGRILLARRRETGMLGGLWEFPGGKTDVADAGTLSRVLCEKVLQETGLKVAVGEPLCTINHAYSHFHIRLHAFLCRVETGRARPLASDEVRWVSPGELGEYAMSAVGRKIVAALERQRDQDR